MKHIIICRASLSLVQQIINYFDAKSNDNSVSNLQMVKVKGADKKVSEHWICTIKYKPWAQSGVQINEYLKGIK